MNRLLSAILATLCTILFADSVFSQTNVLEPTGNAGIGTTTPRGKLDVDGPGDIYLVDDPDAGTNQSLYVPGHIWLSPYNGSNVSYLQARRSNSTGTTSLRIRTWNNGAMSESFHIEGNGNIGIGTTSPDKKVDIRTSSALEALQIQHSNSKWIRIFPPNLTGGAYNGMTEAGDAGIIFGNTAVNTVDYGFVIAPHQDAAGGLRISPTGNVGIGTASPQTRLDLGGLRFDHLSSFPAEGNVSEFQWGNYIIGDPSNSSQRALKLGVANDGYTKAEIFIDNGNRVDGTIAFKTINVNAAPVTRMFIHGNGNIGIGTTSPDARLTVKGTIHSEEVKVDLNVPAPDYVFGEDYILLSLPEVAAYIRQNEHLPEVPSAKAMEENGIDLGEMNMLLLKKVEELTLYVIEQNRKLEIQQQQIKAQQVLVEELIDRLALSGKN